MLVRVKKIWMGHVSVRDYLVKQALQRGETLTVDYLGEEKDYPPEQLDDLLKNSTHTQFKSKFGGTYTLIDLPWE
jgi:hypothetical protein